MGTKKCSACGETKLHDEFSRKADAKDGFRHHCKPCTKRYYRDWRERRGVAVGSRQYLTGEERQLVCGNSLCGKAFFYTGGASHLNRHEIHYCSRRCQHIIHGESSSIRWDMWTNARKRAKDKGWPFDLELEDIPEVPEKCPILGIPLARNTKIGPSDNSPSLDRMAPSRGYVKGNIRIISYKANRCRSNATANELRLLAEDAITIEEQHAQ